MAIAGMEEPAEYDIVVKKGSKFELNFTIEDESGPKDLTGWSFKAQLLTKPGGTVLLTFDASSPGPLSGMVRVYAAASSTGNIPATAVGYADPAPPAKFYPGYWDIFGAPTASVLTDDECVMQGVGKVYPRGSVR